MATPCLDPRPRIVIFTRTLQTTGTSYHCQTDPPTINHVSSHIILNPRAHRSTINMNNNCEVGGECDLVGCARDLTYCDRDTCNNPCAHDSYMSTFLACRRRRGFDDLQDWFWMMHFLVLPSEFWPLRRQSTARTALLSPLIYYSLHLRLQFEYWTHPSWPLVLKGYLMNHFC